jgi:hypothetical protein
MLVDCCNSLGYCTYCQKCVVNFVISSRVLYYVCDRKEETDNNVLFLYILDCYLYMPKLNSKSDLSSLEQM